MWLAAIRILGHGGKLLKVASVNTQHTTYGTYRNLMLLVCVCKSLLRFSIRYAIIKLMWLICLPLSHSHISSVFNLAWWWAIMHLSIYHAIDTKWANFVALQRHLGIVKCVASLWIYKWAEHCMVFTAKVDKVFFMEKTAYTRLALLNRGKKNVVDIAMNMNCFFESIVLPHMWMKQRKISEIESVFA